MLPNIPTDTLYKFMTMTGVIIVVFCLWAVRDNLVRDAETANLMEKLTTEIQLSGLEMRQTQAALVRETTYNQRLRATSSQLQDQANSPQLQAQIAASDKKKEDLEAALLQSIQKDQMSETDRSVRMEQYARLHDQTAIEFWLCAVGVVIGFIFTVYGFRLWYTKQQRYLDIILVAQSAAPQAPPAPPPAAAP